MSRYRGVNGVARKVAKRYRGVSGVARKITKGYRGISGVARRYFSSIWWEFIVNTPPAEYILKVENKTLAMSGTSGTETSGLICDIRGENLASKQVSFDCISSGYNMNYSTIELLQINSSGQTIKTTALTDSGAKSLTLEATTYFIRFQIWLGASGRTASLNVSNLIIGGESVF